jgi:hypothetical protein
MPFMLRFSPFYEFLFQEQTPILTTFLNFGVSQIFTSDRKGMNPIKMGDTSFASDY